MQGLSLESIQRDCLGVSFFGNALDQTLRAIVIDKQLAFTKMAKNMSLSTHRKVCHQEGSRENQTNSSTKKATYFFLGD